jgi:hypothetical protein
LKPELPERVRTHFSARVVLTRADHQTVREASPLDLGTEGTVTRDEIYKMYFHGPAYRVLERAHVGESGAVGVMARPLPPNTAPYEVPTLIAPRFVELCFQTAGIWALVKRREMSLPLALGSFECLALPCEGTAAQFLADMKTRDGGESYDGVIVDTEGRLYARLTGYRTVNPAGNEVT